MNKIIFSILPLILIAGCASQTTESQLNNIVNVTNEITITENNFKLIPNTIEVSKGDTVKLIVKNEEGIHNLFIEGYNLRTVIKQSQNIQEIIFVADKEGEFKIYCEVFGHREKGMEGILIVS